MEFIYNTMNNLKKITQCKAPHGEDTPCDCPVHRAIEGANEEQRAVMDEVATCNCSTEGVECDMHHPMNKLQKGLSIQINFGKWAKPHVYVSSTSCGVCIGFMALRIFFFDFEFVFHNTVKNAGLLNK